METDSTLAVTAPAAAIPAPPVTDDADDTEGLLDAGKLLVEEISIDGMCGVY